MPKVSPIEFELGSIFQTHDERKARIDALHKRLEFDVSEAEIRSKLEEVCHLEQEWFAEQLVRGERANEIFRCEFLDISRALQTEEHHRNLLIVFVEAAFSAILDHLDDSGEIGRIIEHALTGIRQEVPPLPSRAYDYEEAQFQAEFARWDKYGVPEDLKKEVAKMTYSDYLQTDVWDWNKRKALARDEYRCRVCNSSISLNVHHRKYSRWGEERLSDLTTLCRECHAKFHDKFIEART